MNREMLSAARKLQLQVEDQWARRRSKKDAVLHLRIEADLVERVKEEAKAKSLSISDYVRMRLVEGFEKPSTESANAEFLNITDAWTKVSLVRDGACALCADDMQADAEAWLAVGPPPPARFICDACHRQLINGNGR